MVKWTALGLLVVMVLGGCSAGSGDSAQISAAVQTIDPKLRSFYSHSYAGLDVDGDRLVVHRRPDAALDTFVREQVKGVHVEFQDAPYALDTLQPLADRVNRDRHYWSTRQFPVTLAVPRTDGTGVNVAVTADDLDAARTEFRQRYGDEPIVVDRAARTGVVPAG